MRVAGVADIGGTHTRVALVQEDYRILVIERFSTPAGTDPFAVPDLVRAVLSRFLETVPDLEFTGIGVSAAGPVDNITGSIIHPPNMSYDIIPITGPLKNAFRCPVLLMNDCRAAVAGEAVAGAAIGFHHIVYITISTGIGGGVYTDGRVLLGRGGNAGEIGHFTVDTTYMHPCSCGYTGHWEGYASGRGIPGFFKAWCRIHMINPGFPCMTAKEILDAAAGDEPDACLFADTLARINARGLSTVIVAYDPEIIILDGPVVTSHPDLILTLSLRHIDRYLDLPKIVISPLCGNAPLLGAAARVFRLPGTYS
jgi:glucokinase